MNERPLPKSDPATAPYWSAARDHRLMVPVCRSCGECHFYPRAVCPHCGSSDLDLKECGGAGEVYSFTIVRRAPSPAFAAQVPYTVAIVALDEGPHMMSNVVGVPPEDLRIGTRVTVRFLDVSETLALPIFEVAS